MLNEGLIVNNNTTLLKSQIVNQIRRLGSTTPDQLERAVFEALVGHTREEVDWDVEDNQAGYYSWLKTFDRLIQELIEDGHIRTEKPGTLEPTEVGPVSEYSHLKYPPGSSS